LDRPSRRSSTKNSSDGGISNKSRLPAGLSLTLGAPASRSTCDSSDRSPSSSSTTISPAFCILYKARFRRLLTVLPARCNVGQPSQWCDDTVSCLATRASGGGRQAGPPAGLGQCLLAHQQGSACLDQGAQPHGQAGRQKSSKCAGGRCALSDIGLSACLPRVPGSTMRFYTCNRLLGGSALPERLAAMPRQFGSRAHPRMSVCSS